VINEAHVSQIKAIRRQLQGCAMQRCRVRLASNLMQRVHRHTS
jgi:hypothetical protein